MFAHVKKFTFALAVITLVGGVLFASDSAITLLTNAQEIVAQASDPSTISLGPSSCSGWSTDKGNISGWCASNPETITQICVEHGFTNYTSFVQGGAGGATCGWGGTWRCDSSCTTSCAGQNLTSVSCSGSTDSGGTAPSCTLSASPNGIVTGGTSTLSWSSIGAAFMTLSNSIGSVTVPSGSLSISPSVTTTYTATVYESVTQPTETASIPVGASCFGYATDNGWGWGYCWASQADADVLCKLNGYDTATNFSSGGPGGRVCSGNATDWSDWRCDSSCKSCGGATLTAVSCSKQGSGPATGSGASSQCSVTVSVNPPPTPTAPTADLSLNPTSITSGASSTLTWTSTDTTSCTGTNFSTGGATSGSLSVSAATTTVYSISCTGAGGTTTDTATLTVTPSPQCSDGIDNDGDGVIDYPADFSCSSPTDNDETNPKAQCQDGIDNDQDGTIDYPQDPGCQSNQDNDETNAPPSSVTVVASKIICPNESDLPNWGGGASISSSTAATFLVTHPSCHLDPTWTFEYASGNTSNIGDNHAGLSGGAWHPFTSAATFALSSLSDQSRIWVREVVQSGYVPFAGLGLSNVSAEMWCHTDVLNYDNYDFIGSPVAGQTYYCVAFNAPIAAPTPAPTATLAATPDTIVQGDTSSLAWSSTNATSCTGTNFSTGGATSGSTNVSPSTTTTYSVSCTGAGGTATATATVTVAIPGPHCALSVSDSHIHTGQSVVLSWTSSNTTSGSIDHNGGTASPVGSGSVTLYPSSDTTFTGTFVGSAGTTTCSVHVDVDTGAGACQGDCGGGGGGGGGGGYNQPNVVLYQKAGDEPFASATSAPAVLGVTLSQVPYTGFEAGPALTIIFWLAIALLAALVSYFIVGKGGVHALLGALAGYVHMPVPTEYVEKKQRDRIYGPAYPAVTDESEEHEAPVVMVAAAPAAALVAVVPTVPVSAPAEPEPQQKVAQTGLPVLTDVIESRAHAAGVLLSPEAVRLAAELSDDRAETLRIFGDIVNDAVMTVPREDGWIMLTSDRFNTIAAKKSASSTPLKASEPAAIRSSAMPTYVLGARATAPTAPVTPNAASRVLDESAASTFAGAVLSGDRETAFAIVRALEHDKVSPTNLMTSTASVLDKLYRARKDGHGYADTALVEKAAVVSDEHVEHLVSVFAHALDAVYASPFTGAKLALAQAFEVAD